MAKSHFRLHFTAAIAMHVVDDALAVLDEMATFTEAGVAHAGQVRHAEAECPPRM